MPAETEYSRTYKQFQLSPPSPDDPLPIEPHSIPLSVPAGLSSAKLGVTQEPPVGRKRKTDVHDRKVTFTTDYTEHGSPTKMDNKGLKFRAGYRRQDVSTPTVYQLQYTWPDPPPSEAPLLNAELMLHSSKYPTDPHSSSQEGYKHHDIDRASTGPRSKTSSKQSKGGNRGGIHLPLPVEKGDGNEDVLNGNTRADIDIERQPGSKVKKDTKSVKKDLEVKRKKESTNHHVRAHHAKHQIRELLSKQPCDKEKGQSSKLSKKHRKKIIKQFVTEYQRQYSNWPVSNGKVTKKKKKKSPTMTIPAGVPRVLTDSSDPRLLKHSPLPINGKMRLLSDYQANYVSPTDCDFAEGVWKGVSPTEHAQEKGSEEPIPASHSWYNQLVELRHSAEMYKKRAEGVNVARLLPLTRRDVESYRDITPSVTSSDSISCTPSSPTPSDSVSCTGSDNLVRITTPPKPTAPPTHTYEKIRNSGSPYLRDGSAHKHSGKGMNVQDIEDFSSETLSEIGSHSDSVPEHTVDPNVGKNGTIPHTHGSSQRPKAQSTSDSEGRVQTPNIQKSSSDFQRHHLDLTTPVDGGLFLSPKKSSTDPENVSLPFPPVSPKFRRDMKSRAPVTPPPPRPTKDECIQVNVDIVDPSQTSQTSSPPMENVHSNALPQKHSRHVPATSSPYHSQCVPGRKDKEASGSIRKLDFGPHKTAHTRFTASKNNPKSYAHRVEGNTHTQKDNCDICGAHLNTLSTRHSWTVGQAPSHKSVPKAHSAQNRHGSSHLTNGRPGAPTRLQYTSPSLCVPSYSQRPLSSTNYMTRLPAQGGVMDRSRDIDEVSLASLSLSSCSVASDVLKKARDRRDHFWTQPRLTAT